MRLGSYITMGPLVAALLYPKITSKLPSGIGKKLARISRFSKHNFTCRHTPIALISVSVPSITPNSLVGATRSPHSSTNVAARKLCEAPESMSTTTSRSPICPRNFSKWGVDKPTRDERDNEGGRASSFEFMGSLTRKDGSGSFFPSSAISSSSIIQSTWSSLLLHRWLGPNFSSQRKHNPLLHFSCISAFIIRRKGVELGVVLGSAVRATLGWRVPCIMDLIVGWVWMVRVGDWNPTEEDLFVDEDSPDRWAWVAMFLSSICWATCIICDRPIGAHSPSSALTSSRRPFTKALSSTASATSFNGTDNTSKRCWKSRTEEDWRRANN